MKNLKIFIGVVPDSIHDHGDFDLLVIDKETESLSRLPIAKGDNAKVIEINEATLLAFVPVGGVVNQQLNFSGKAKKLLTNVFNLLK